MTEDQYIDQKSEEWFTAQAGGCSCHMGNPPCGWCENGYNLTLAEYLEYALEEFQAGPDGYEADPHEVYDRAMKDLF